MQLGPPRTGSGMSFMAGSFLRPLDQWQTPGRCHKSLRWGQGGPLSKSVRVSCLGAINEPTVALAQHHTVAGRLGLWQEWIPTPGSHKCLLYKPVHMEKPQISVTETAALSFQTKTWLGKMIRTLPSGLTNCHRKRR